MAGRPSLTYRLGKGSLRGSDDLSQVTELESNQAGTGTYVF